MKSGHEAAWVLHFVRTGGPSPSNRPFYWSIAEQQRLQADTLSRALELSPNLLFAIRGLDLASKEMESPLWLALPHIVRVRETSRNVAAARGGGLEPLRLIVHVGEDFRHIVSGLRAVHEPTEWGLLRCGDRLGHAIALGLDVQRRYETQPTAPVRRWSRIQDLAWLLAFCKDHQLDAPATLLASWHAELLEHADDLWRREPAVSVEGGCTFDDAMSFVGKWPAPGPMRHVAVSFFLTYVAGRSLDLLEARLVMDAMPLTDRRVERVPGVPALLMLGTRAQSE